jgi:LysM repeat protein
VPKEAGVPDEKDTGFGVHTENIIDEMDKIEAMAALVESVIVWRAQYIAWNVDIFMAETLLFRLIFREGSQNPQAMDLLARIYFQQGKYEKARGLWEKALELQPGNPALRRAVTEMRSIAKSPGSTVTWHRIGVFLNCLLTLLVICVLGLFITLGYNRLLEWADGTPTVAVQNLEERFFDSHYQKFAPAFRDDVASAASSRFDYFIPFPFSAADGGAGAGERAPYQIEADFAGGDGVRNIGFTRKKVADGKEIGRIEVVVERVGTTLRAAGKIPSLHVRYLVEEALWKVPGITDLDLRGLVIDRTYRVNRGDSLWIIAKRVYGQGSSWTLLAKANDLRDPSKLKIGQELVLPLGDEIITEVVE